MRSLAVLDVAECEEVRRLVHALKGAWMQRAPLPFFTLGAATYMDANGGRRTNYGELACRLNPVLHEHFGWLHDRVQRELSTLLGLPVLSAPRLALPGFHIFLAHPAFTQPLASVHLDLQYQEHDWATLGEPDYDHPLSFTLAVTLPEAGSGLLTWPQGIADARRLPRADFATLLAREPPTFVPYTLGTMVVHDGHLVHQIAPLSRVAPGDERITLQGHALRCGDAWYAYW